MVVDSFSISSCSPDIFILRLFVGLTTGADPSVPKENFKWNPLHLAAREDKPAIIEALLAAGAAIDAVNRDKETALFVAAYYGSKGAVKVFVDKGADGSLANEKGTKPREAVCSCLFEEVADGNECASERCTTQAQKNEILELVGGKVHR